MNAKRTSVQCEAVVFDLDGTLIDSAPSVRFALNRLLVLKGREPLESARVRKVLEGSGGGHVGRAFAATGAIPDKCELRDLRRRYREIRDGEAAHLTTAYRGVSETLDTLRHRGIKLGICTKRPLRSAETILERLELKNFFSTVSGRDSVPKANRKPHPAHLLAVLVELEAPVRGAVMVGDKANDVAMARGAGVPVILAAGGYSGEPPESLGADAVLRRFADLPRALAQALTG